MREPIAALGQGRLPRRARLAGVAVCVAALLISGCSDDTSEAASEPSETPSATDSSSKSTSESPSSSPTEESEPKPKKPKEPKFRSGKKGQKAFVAYIVDGWSYALRTNDPSVLLGASGKKPCRGCKPVKKELKQRKKEGWYVDFSGAKIRKISFGSRGSIREATAVVTIPKSRSFFDDGTFRNDNKAHKKAKFLIDIEAKGKPKKRHWELVAFSVK